MSVLAEMPFYQDVGFYKRAQLTAADLSVAHVAAFADLDRLTIFADNLVPHVLRVDGILRYEPGLLAAHRPEELIPSGSAEEVEIPRLRAYAVELIAARCADAESRCRRCSWTTCSGTAARRRATSRDLATARGQCSAP